jgi:hypothetical protein
MTGGLRKLMLVLAAVAVCAPLLGAQVSFDHILAADREPQNWLTYSGTLNGQATVG